MLGALSQHGKLGITVIGDSVDEVENLYRKVEHILDKETSLSLEKLSLSSPPHTPLLFMEATTRYTFARKLSAKNSTLTFGTGPLKLLVTVCVHGDEVCGLRGVNELVDEGYFETIAKDKITLTIMLANPLAFSQGVRFVHRNLNRVILPHLFEVGGYETFRGRSIANAILDCDVYLDLHSTSAASPPLCLPAANPQSEELSKTFPVDYVIEELAHATEIRGTTIDWAYFHKKKAISIECGQHASSEAIGVAKRVIKHLVELSSCSSPSLGMLSACTPLSTPPKVMRCVGREKVRKGFKYKQNLKSLQLISSCEIVAEDETGPLKGPTYPINQQGVVEGGFVVMPTAIPYEGEEAFYWLVPSSD